MPSFNHIVSRMAVLLRQGVVIMLVHMMMLFLGTTSFISHTYADSPDSSLIKSDAVASGDPATCLDLKRMMQQDLQVGKYLGKKIVCGSMTLADIPYYIKIFLEFAFNAVSSIAVVAIMWSGVAYMRSKDKDASEARKRLKSAIIGFIVFLSSFTIVRLLSFIFTVS